MCVKILIILEFSALLIALQGIPQDGSTPRPSQNVAKKRKISEDSERRLNKVRAGISVFSRASGSERKKVPSKCDSNRKNAIDDTHCSTKRMEKSSKMEYKKRNFIPETDRLKYEVELSNAQTIEPVMVTLPNALSAWEMRDLEQREQQNRNIERLRAEMQLEWSRAHSPQPLRPLHGYNFGSEQNQVQRSESLEDQLNRLQAERVHLDSQVGEIGRVIDESGESRITIFEAGPCNGLSDEPIFHGMSARMLVAAGEAIAMNMCNRLTEVRAEIRRITEELNRRNAELRRRSCESYTNNQSSE
ncbi:hypothetical protein QAD02_000069 [Eretmocerus hayati]|uniref:Uncharacterized protein n=1 Tax=Eretmocerus hayati TaxID=131215 RepID=A0ACC2NCE9_9HYME|nr:hypothetical protein QAD02_000069 [Eretmocerus hayati]